MNTDLRQKHGHISWGELCTTDTEAAKSFYNKLFGWEYEACKSSTGADYTVCLKEENPVVGMMNLSDIPFEGLPPHWGFYVTVDCIDTALEQTKTNGGNVIMGRTPLDCGGAFAIIEDPQGATLGIMQQPNDA